jgi:hypothetical protein
MALAFNVNFQSTDAHGSNSKTAVALKKQINLGNYSKNSMACVQVDLVQALLPEFPRKIQFLYYISAKSKQTLY